MWARRRYDESRHLSALVLAVIMASSVLVLIPRLAEYGAAITPAFSRPNVRVDSNVGWVYPASPGGPVIAIDSSGRLHAAWSDNSSGVDRGIYYANSTDGGATWSSPQRRIDGFAGAKSYTPSIAIDMSGGPYNGRIYVAWQVLLAAQYDIYVVSSNDGGNTWSALDRYQVDTGGATATSPRVAVDDADGRVYVSFQDARNGNLDIFVARSGDGGATWLSETQISTSTTGDGYSSLSARGGTICVAWQEAGPTATTLWLACSMNEGNAWQTNSIITLPAGTGDARFTSIAVGSGTTVHVVFTKEDALGETWIAYTQTVDRGVSWTGLVQVDDVPAISAYLPNGVGIMQSSGVLYVVWSDNRNGDNDVFASWSEDNGATWGDGSLNNNDVRVDDTDENAPGDDSTEQVAPSAIAGPIGIYVIWSDKRNPPAYHAYFSSFEISELIITEVRDSPNGSEQVELYNHGGRTIDMTGWRLIVDGVTVILTPLAAIPPGAYRTVGDPPTSSLVIDIALGDEGGYVQLQNPSAAVKNSVYYGQLGPAPDPLDTESVARVPSGGGYTSNWARAAVPTFGAPNGGVEPIANPPLVLNEVLFNAVNPNSRFIELYFKSFGSLNIGGYVLAGDAAFTLPSVVLSAANPFYVLRPSQAPALFSQMTASGDNLYLYEPGGALLDMVGWSSAHNQDFSMVRVPDGFGTANGYDDPTSIAAGWQFNMVPSLPLVLVGPRQTKGGDLGARVFYVLTITNKEPVDSYANVQVQLGPQSWSTTLFMADGFTPLADSPGDPDSIPDTGLLAPEAQVNIQVSVDVPPVPQVQDWETCSIVATIAGDPMASASIPLTTNIYPYESPAASVNPTTIWLETAPPAYLPKETTVTLTVTGRGTAMFRQRPQDTVLMMDSSGSMGSNDPTNRRLTAAKHYIDLLAVPDRAAVVDFDEDAILVGNDHLSSDYPHIKANIDTIDSFGSTNLYDPIRITVDELVAYGNQSHIWVGIMMTDGDEQQGHTDAQILGQAQRAADNGIVIFTVGLVDSGGGMNEPLLQQIAQITGGVYMRAQTASDLDAIFALIGQIVKNMAGYDDDVTDDIPMIGVLLPTYIHYVGATANPAPSYAGLINGQMNLQWNLSKLTINETWTATFRVTSGMSGAGLDGEVLPDSRVTYMRYDDTRISIPFPQVHINVLEPPPPPPTPVNCTITRNPLMGNVTVDGFNYTAGTMFSWLSGEIHNIRVWDPDMVGGGSRWVFDEWDDGGAIAHDITIGRSDLTITANYSQQHQPIVNLLGLDSLHGVAAHFTSRGLPVDQPGLSGTWSDWVDNGTALSFDTTGANSNATEHWVTQMTFNSAPWDSVTAAFTRDVFYWHQVTPTIIFQGLPLFVSVPISFTVFGSVKTAGTATAWTDWVDYGSAVSVGGRVDVPPSTRYINLISKGATSLQFTITSARTIVVPFMAQFRPTVCLIGTNQDHTVDVRFNDSTVTPVRRVAINVSGIWTDWADDGSFTLFSSNTSGYPPRRAVNATQLLVDSVFSACIIYEPPPPVSPEPNYKPLISLAFVALLLILGLFWGNRKPWDRHIPDPLQPMKPEELAKREAELRKMPIADKFKVLSLAELEEKFAKDRYWTMSTLAMPFAVVEGIIGVASLATGILRVPDSGNWLSAGLIVNTLLLLAGIIYDAFMQSRGYRVPGEAELASLKQEDMPKEVGLIADEKGQREGGVAAEKILGTVLGLQTLIGDFIVPREYDLIFTDKRLVFAKRAGYTRKLGDTNEVTAGQGETAPPKYVANDLDRILDEKKANFALQYKVVTHAAVGGLFGKKLRIATYDLKLRMRVPKADLPKLREAMHATLPQFGF